MLRKLFITLTAAIATIAIALPVTPAHARVDELPGYDTTTPTTAERRAERIERDLLVSRSAVRTPVADTYKVKRGDTLAEIAKRHDIKGGYVALWGANLKKIDHPDLLTAGQVLTLDSKPAKGKKALAKLPVATTAAPSSGTTTTTYSGSGRCGGELPSCAIMYCESGGDIRAENPTSTASGKWQIIDGTWAGYGGYSHASHAPEHIQDERAAQIWAGGAGRGNWVC